MYSFFFFFSVPDLLSHFSVSLYLLICSSSRMTVMISISSIVLFTHTRFFFFFCTFFNDSKPNVWTSSKPNNEKKKSPNAFYFFVQIQIRRNNDEKNPTVAPPYLQHTHMYLHVCMYAYVSLVNMRGSYEYVKISQTLVIFHGHIYI